MRQRLTLAAAIGSAALIALAGCGSSTSSSGSSGSTTLAFFGADYGTGPANSTTKYWDAIASAFHKANPSITVTVQTVNWTDFPNKVQTLVQNKQFPDILEGDTAPQFTPSTRALYYNKKIFAAAGISSPPQTWAQLQSDAAAIKAKGYIGYGMPLGSEEAQAEALLWFLGNGGGYVNSSGGYAIDSAQNVQALQFMSGL